MQKHSIITILMVMFFVAFSKAQSTYVIVHGAWGGAWQFKNTAKHLQEAGHTVYRPTMTGLGERHHLYNSEVNLTTHITDVVNTILFEDLNDVILVGHSYGGMVVTGVADSIPNRIKKIVYLDAIIPEENQSAVQALGMDETNAEQAFKVENGVIVPPWVKDTTKTPRDVPHPIATFIQPLRYSANKLNDCPITYIFTYQNEFGGKEKDDFYRFYVKAKEKNWKIVEMEASHNPQIDKLNELVAILLDEVK
ncbi:alpha/beta hydrolase [Sphingobacterium composti Ten et al. 2007 non Yoo et al. 2007]|uniref:alpha/beta hydrolase n=1 Tax=Sphingobacterium composti TaxID=363260 RepID=UPI0013581379|nr:alpha/beta hydrolase [Sphingobacterium composti Ten et al. 2007 non Yoo et al. 2007]